MEARHEAQMAALRAAHSPTPGGQSVRFIPNKGFHEITPFSGARGQDLLPFLQQLRSRANILQTPEDDVARELCLKLTGDALQAYNQHFTPDANPTFDEVAASLAKTFIKPYQGAARWNAFFRFKRLAGSSGKEVKQQLHNARQACLDDGIPVDDMSSAEHLYYIYQLSLSPSQSAQFLASLSSNPVASDDHLRSLTPTGEADRRGSVAGVRSSAARTALFRICSRDRRRPPPPAATSAPALCSPHGLTSRRLNAGSGWPAPSASGPLSLLQSTTGPTISMRLPTRPSLRSASSRAPASPASIAGSSMMCSTWIVHNMAAAPPPSSGGTSACLAPSSAPRTSDWLRPGPYLRQPPHTWRVGGLGFARRPVCAPARASAGPSHRTDRDPPGQDQVPQVRRGHRPTNAGAMSPLHLPARRRRSGSPRLPSCPLGRRRRCLSSGRTGTHRGDCHPARGESRRSGALGMRGRRLLTSGRRRRRTRSTTRSTPLPRPCRHS